MALQGGNTRRHFFTESCILLNYPSLSSPTSRGGVKQLTCGPEKYVTAVFIVLQESSSPTKYKSIHIFYARCKLQALYCSKNEDSVSTYACVLFI